MKNNVELDSRWKNTLLDIVEQIGENTYISWFSKVKFESSDEGILVLKMPTDMHKQHIEKYYSKKLLEIATKHFREIKEIWLLSPKETLEERQAEVRQKKLISDLMEVEFPKWEHSLTHEQRREINPCHKFRSDEFFATAVLKGHFKSEILMPKLQKSGIIKQLSC